MPPAALEVFVRYLCCSPLIIDPCKMNAGSFHKTGELSPLLPWAMNRRQQFSREGFLVPVIS